eukprot:1193682-Prorocentrum_minimum.AAC.2
MQGNETVHRSVSYTTSALGAMHSVSSSHTDTKSSLRHSTNAEFEPPPKKGRDTQNGSRVGQGYRARLACDSSWPREGPVRVRVGSLPLAATRGEQYTNSSNHPSIHPSTHTHFRSLQFSIPVASLQPAFTVQGQKALTVRPLRGPAGFNWS